MNVFVTEHYILLFVASNLLRANVDKLNIKITFRTFALVLGF